MTRRTLPPAWRYQLDRDTALAAGSCKEWEEVTPGGALVTCRIYGHQLAKVLLAKWAKAA